MVIAACSDRKTVPVPRAMALRAVPGASMTERFGEWRSRISAATTLKVEASRLYAGDHWRAVERGVAALRRWGPTDLWIASAGLGLVAADERIPPYSATFAAH